ncbi:GNAT family N-acetyltransferase [Motiliproteus sediminis]|uniref:GNAT family N-acetyltransferase n=1 Tax=Motiliproteus sediminis TaxID=1468178 RepID=UPI001AEFA3D5|nr:GNAT family N-acetyltransferase [Motiliproteus sediminis]
MRTPLAAQVASNTCWRCVSAASFGQWHAVWDDLNQRCANSPVLTAAMVATSLEVFGSGDEVLMIAGPEQQPVAMGVFERSRFGVWNSFQPSQAPLGLWLNDGSESLPQLLTLLMKALPGFTLRLGLTQLDPMHYPRPEDDAGLHSFDYIDTARIDMSEGDFDSYWAARGKNLRQNMSKQSNRLQREGVAEQLQCVTAVDDIAAAVADYGMLESRSWKADKGTAVAPDNAQGRFYTRLLQTYAATGQARIYRYWYDQSLVACDLCIEQGGVLVILKTTFDEQHKKTSPAFLMRRAYFPSLFADPRIRSVEFYGRVMEWHTKWSEDVRGIYHLNKDSSVLRIIKLMRN